MDSLSKGVSNMAVSNQKKARRRLSVIGGAGVKQEALDGVRTSESSDKALAAKRASLDMKEKCYKYYEVQSNVGIVPFNPHKVNQDRPMMVTPFMGSLNKALFGVFDGHGQLGHDVSQFVIDNLPEYTANALADAETDAEIEKALKKCFTKCHAKVQEKVDCNFSGTTAVMVYQNGNTLYCANSGDSRATLANQIDEEKFKAHDLSDDQKPEREDEAKRIIANGGRVEACRGSRGEDIGPKRVWLKRQDVPGLAMTRSFGDLIAQSVGVTSEPEVQKFTMTEDSKFMVICSDGVWEFMSSQEVVDLVGKYGMGGGKKAIKDLCAESTRRWNMEEEVVDDTTALIVYF